MNNTMSPEIFISEGMFGNTPYKDNFYDSFTPPNDTISTLPPVDFNPCGNTSIPESSDYCIACIFTYILQTICMVAMFVNVIVILSIFWIRSPMTPNLKISLSLAAADACSSSISGIFMFIEGDGTNLGVLLYIFELLRLSGIVITVVHLLALSVNHYIGILKPLHYNSIVTSRKVAVVICALWLVPILTVLSLCAVLDTDGTLVYNLLHNASTHAKFMDAFPFRMGITTLFSVPIFLMVFCYTHILVVVRKQQNRWGAVSRTGSSRYKGRTVASCKGGNHKLNKEKKQLEGNVRAIYTTLLILGSCFLGWTPALLAYVLMCFEGCYVEGEALVHLNCDYPNVIMVLRLFENILMIMKMLANPIIYSIRMKEIKDGRKRMYQAIRRWFCPCIRRQRNDSLRLRKTQNSASVGTGSVQVRMTSFKLVNGNTNVSFGKDSNNTFL